MSGYGSNSDYYNQQGDNYSGGDYGSGNQGQQHQQQAPYGGGGNLAQGGSYGGGGHGGVSDDLDGAAHYAHKHAGDSGDSGVFSQILGVLGQKKHDIEKEDVDEDEAVQAHRQFFNGGGDSSQQASSKSMGAAAAMEALKMFSGGGSGNSHKGNSQNAFIGAAMGQAAKLFDQQESQGKASNASKESVVQHAGEMAFKMYLKSQGKSGSASGLMGLASKFL